MAPVRRTRMRGALSSVDMAIFSTLVRNPAERLTRSSSQLRRSSHEKIVQPRYDFQIVVRSGAMIKETDGISVGELQPTRYQIGHNAPRSYK
jgi:hypothetical protein